MVAGDFNAKAVERGVSHADSRGRYELEEIARMDVLMLNDGKNNMRHRLHGDRTTHLSGLRAAGITN